MRSRPLSLPAAIAALTAMLFAQAAFAIAACDVGLGRSTPMHVAPASAHEAAPCHEPAETANLCFAHCDNSDVSLDKPQVKVPTIAPAAPLPVHFATVPYPQVAPIRVAALPAGPPPRILFQSFLI